MEFSRLRFLGASAATIASINAARLPGLANPEGDHGATAAPLVALGGAQADQALVIRFAHAFGPASFLGKAAQEWATLVRQRSDARINVQVYPSGQLFNFIQMPAAIAAGSIDVGLIMTPYATSMVPAVGFWALPALFRTDADAFAVARSPVSREVDALFAQKGIQVVAYWPYGGLQWYANKPLRTPADIKGLKMRVNSDVLAEAIKSMGGIPVDIEANEVYLAMQRGTVDGFMDGPSSLIDRKLIEVTKYGVNVSAGFVWGLLAFNRDKWASWPQADRDVLTSTAAQIQRRTEAGVAADDDRKLKAAIKKGLQFYNPTPQEQALWQKVSQPTWDYYYRKAGPEGRSLVAAVLKTLKTVGTTR